MSKIPQDIHDHVVAILKTMDGKATEHCVEAMFYAIDAISRQYPEFWVWFDYNYQQLKTEIETYPAVKQELHKVFIEK